jgi:hypothetical protein
MTPQEYFAKIFRTNSMLIWEMEKKMSSATGKTDIIKNLMNENEHRINKTLGLLNCHDYKAEAVQRALITKLQKDDRSLYNLFKKPSGVDEKGLRILFKFALRLVNVGSVFALKKKKAEEILKKNPPLNIIRALGYKDVKELLKKEDLIEIFSALRFVESREWMHRVFDGAYKNLSPKDFEKRKISLRVLSGKWLNVAEKFVKKKYHNISHLKELGVIFIIPLKIDTPGETLRLFSLILHYLHEIDFYSKLFVKVANKDKGSFGTKIISLLKGEILAKIKTKNSGFNWLIVQRYLAKENKNDPRLFVPHVNPEALHWQKAEKDISNLGKKFKNVNLEIWFELDWVGGFFKTRDKKEELVSFDLVDNVMALVQKEHRIKYLYHHQEALWNEIFERYVGFENLEKLLIENFEKGYISI